MGLQGPTGIRLEDCGVCLLGSICIVVVANCGTSCNNFARFALTNKKLCVTLLCFVFNPIYPITWLRPYEPLALGPRPKTPDLHQLSLDGVTCGTSVRATLMILLLLPLLLGLDDPKPKLVSLVRDVQMVQYSQLHGFQFAILIVSPYS